VVQRWGDVRMHIDWWNPSGAPVGVAVPEVDGLPSGSLSPDARLFAYSATNPPDIFVRDLVSGVSTRLTFESRSYQNLLWSNDGRRLYFAAQTGQAGYEIDSKAADGSGEDSLVFRGPGLFSSPMSVSRDDRWLVAQCSDSSGAFDLWRIPLAGQGKPEIYQRTPANEDGASFSPDGRWLVYSVTNDGKREVFVQSFPVPGTKYQLAIDDIAYCGWVDRQDEMIALTGKGDVLLVSVSTAAGFKQGASRKLFRVGSGFFVIDVQRDMKRFLVASYDTHALSSSLEVVLGWPRLLEKK
jgi:dipeptidyl aminopeptidase/acylaminoacyl peptidase